VHISGLAVPLLVKTKASFSELEVYSASTQTIALTTPLSDLALGRLDVTDVKVPMPGKPTQTVRGRATVGELTFDTGFGLDVLPGTYNVAVTYRHPADGASLTDTYAANVQP
jgi:hypothetical protein